MIEDLGIYIVQLIDKQHEVLLFIDANEPNIYCSGINKLIRRTKMIVLVTVRYGSEHEPKTHQRVFDRIDDVLYTRFIISFITKRSITPFDQISQSDHREIYLDIQVKALLQDNIVSSTLTSRILSPKSSDNVSTYKKNYKTSSKKQIL